MTCLLKDKNKPLLDEYTSMLGSESAAYYVLCKNNGYPLEFTPNGEKSDLFQLLLAKNNYDYEAAIEEKSLMYYASYYDKLGGDWTMMALEGSVVDEKGEPRIDYTPAKIDFSDVISQPLEITEMDILQLGEIQTNMIDEDLDDYIRKAQPVGMNQHHSTQVQWLKDRQKKLVNSINKDLIKAFGLEKHVDKDGNVTFVSKAKDEQGRPQLIIQFCEYIENGKRGVYDQTKRIEAAVNVIQISLMDGDFSTINHELAHHYVRMFWNSEVIQAAVLKLDNGDRSEGWQVRLEEKLVKELTSRTVEAEGLWNKFGSMVKSAFMWISSPIKQSLLRKASLAFRMNDTANIIRKEQDLLLFIDPNAKRVFDSPLNESIEEFESFRSRYGLKEAVRVFTNRSFSFFVSYYAEPDSILKREYDEFVVHVKNALADTTITNEEFNELYIQVMDVRDEAVRTYHDIRSPQRMWAMAVMDIMNEIRLIRDTIHASSTSMSSDIVIEDTDINIDALIKILMRSLLTRVYEYLHMVPKSAKLANFVQELIDKVELLKDNIDKIKLFISEGLQELNDIHLLLIEYQKNDYKDLDSQKLKELMNTVDGFYAPIIDMIWKDMETLVQKEGVFEEFGAVLGRMLSLRQDIQVKLEKASLKVAQRESHEYLIGNEETGQRGVVDDLLTDEQKERFLYNFDDQLILGKLFEDINSFLPHIGLASRSRSMVIRMARNMILSANAEIRKSSIKDAAHIVKLYMAALPEMKKLGLKEVQSVFQELDEKGLPTGYFVRRLNYGKFYRDLDDTRARFIDEANQKLKELIGDDAPLITYDVYDNPIFPPDDDPIVKSILTDYADKVDDWLCEHSDRMFNTDYYKMRKTMLSPKTRKVMLDIQNRISQLTSKAPIVKVTDTDGRTSDVQATWELSPEDQQSLVQLLMEYKQLGSHYYSDGTKKTGEALDIAEEISNFNEWRNKQIKHVQNDAKFEATIQKIREKFGEKSEEEARFRKLNTTIKVNPDYYDWVMTKVRLIEDETLDKLRKRRNDLKKLIEDFDKKGIDVETKRRQAMYWESLKEIDAAIRERIEELSFGERVPPEERWDYYFDKEFVMYDEDETLLDHMIKQDIREYRRTHPADERSDEQLKNELIRKYLYTVTWYDADGNPHSDIHLVSVFTRDVPKGASINKMKMEGTFARKALITEYSYLFSDIDPTSPLYNENFDRNDSHLVQPKHDEYRNDEQWDRIQNNEKIKALYDALIELMNRNNSKLPNNADFSYKLPQISARRLTILRRSSNLKEVFDSVKYNFKMDWTVNERDDSDINYGNDIRRANGDRINTVPVRYTHMEDPTKITSDVIGSVIAFTEMANNFTVKTQLSSKLEAVKQALMDRENANFAKSKNQQSTANIVKQLKNMMDDLLYANTTKIMGKENSFSKKEQMIIKFFTRFQRLGRILMLGWNFASMNVGFFESYIRGNIEAILGKDYNMRDLMYAYWKFMKYGIPMLTQMNSVNARNKQVALMQWFGVSKRLKESYHSTERNRYIRLLSENINGMFGFMLGDYANSSFLLSMALSNNRFIGEGNDEGIPAGFYTKLTIIVAIRKKNPELSYRQAKARAMVMYKESGVCLEDAYDFYDGMIHVKPEYAKYVDSVLENRVTGKCYQRLAEALGVTPTDDNPGYSLYVYLRPLGVLRNYLFTVIARNWNWAHDLQHRYLDPSGQTVKEDDMIDGYVDIDAGNMAIGVHQGLIGWMKMVKQLLPLICKLGRNNNYTEETKELYNYAAKKVGLEILSICILVGIATLFKALQKGDKDPDWWEQFGYLTSVRLVNSFISILDPTAFLEIIKNISTLTSPLTDILNLITILSDMVGLSGHSPFDEIKTGSYKGRTRLFKDIMRVIPLGNAYEDLAGSALKSRANWYIQQDPLTWGTIGGAYDQLWGAGE